MEKTYWNKKGKYQKKYDALYKEHVPAKGMAKTIKGELLRCISRLYYDVYNNGLCNDKTYEIEFIKSYFDCDIEIPLLVKGNELEGYFAIFETEKELIENTYKELEDLTNKIIETL